MAEAELVEMMEASWPILQRAFDLWTTDVLMAWAGTLSAPNAAQWRGFVSRYELDGAKLMRITFDELKTMGCPDVGTFWRHVISWRYVVTVPAAFLVARMNIHRERYGSGPPAMVQDWHYAQNRLSRDFMMQ